MYNKLFIFLFIALLYSSNIYADNKKINKFANIELNDIVEIVVKGSEEDLNNYILNNKISNEDGRIAAQVALLLNKNKMLEILVGKDFFPCEEPLLSKENVISLELINLNTVKKEISDIRNSWGDDGVEGDCASLDPNSIIITSDSTQFEIILKNNKWMCKDEILMCGATTQQIVSSEPKKEKVFRKICEN